MANPSEPAPQPTEPGEPSDPALEKIERGVLLLALWGGGFFLFVLMMIVVGDATMRYLFNSPIPGGRDFDRLSLIIVVAVSLAYSARSGGQVAVELFVNLISPRKQQLVFVVVHAITGVMLAILAWQLWIAGKGAAEMGEASPLLSIPYRPFYVALALGVALYLLVVLAEIVSVIRTGRAQPHRMDN